MRIYTNNVSQFSDNSRSKKLIFFTELAYEKYQPVNLMKADVENQNFVRIPVRNIFFIVRYL